MNRKRSVYVAAGIVLLTALLTACAGNSAQNSESAAPQATPIPPTQAVEVVAEPSAEAGEPVIIEGNGEVPFYARFGENETFSDGEWTVVVFYRPPGCIPADFNLNQFFHFPGENSPGAFACAPPTTTSIETWANGPETDPAPLVSKMTGRGAVPVWFFAQADMEMAMEDGTVTIAELQGLPSRLAGEADTYAELLHPSQSNSQSLIQFNAEGALEDGRTFLVDVSYGAPDEEDHTTIEIQ